MIRINQLTLPVDHGEEAIKKKAAKLLQEDLLDLNQKDDQQ